MVSRRVHVLLCEPFLTGSHRWWAAGLAAHSRHDVHVLSHPGRFWKWRMQGAALTIAEQVDAHVEAHGPPDVLLVSDMVHVPALLGFARRSLHDVSVIVYFHESQLTYPLADGAEPDHTYAMTNWLSAAVADRVVFNSHFHRAQFFSEVRAFLDRFPDERHTHQVDRVAGASTVLPVGVDLPRFHAPPREGQPPVVLWNHRWEHDKGPDTFFAALKSLAGAGLPFQVVLAGERYERAPDVFRTGVAALGERVIHAGTAGADDYPALLRRADIVVSTAKHEFFGVAVVEAVAAGCLPLLPDRLSYPELVPSAEPFLYRDEEDLIDRLRWAITDGPARAAAASAAQRHMARFDWSAVAPEYDRLLDDVVSARSPRP
jgi:glycosyltransferase involved in cell wall biosynthesis